jgi:hypothetical protein
VCVSPSLECLLPRTCLTPPCLTPLPWRHSQASHATLQCSRRDNRTLLLWFPMQKPRLPSGNSQHVIEVNGDMSIIIDCDDRYITIDLDDTLTS